MHSHPTNKTTLGDLKPRTRDEKQVPTPEFLDNQKPSLIVEISVDTSYEPDQEVYKDLAHFFASQKQRICTAKHLMNEIGPLIPHMNEDPLTGEKVKLTRERFSREELQLLKATYAQNNHWTKQMIQDLAEEMNYSEEKVYKWYNGIVNKLRRQGL